MLGWRIGAWRLAVGMLTNVETIEMMNSDLTYTVDQTKLLHAICRRAGIPRHTNAPERIRARGAPD